VSIRSIRRNMTKLSVKSFQHNETNTVSASLLVYCHSSWYRYFKFDFKTLQWCLSTVSLASSDVTTDAENVLIVCLRCRSRDKVECHGWQTWN